MSRRQLLWSALVALPLAGLSGLVYAFVQTRPYVCPITGEVLPCPKCCPLQASQSQRESFTCPLTGEELPCPQCCPLTKQD
jgi:hypothetical protein